MHRLRWTLLPGIVWLAAGLVFPPRLAAQPYAQYGSGVSTVYSYFDPAAPRTPPRTPLPQITITEHRPVVISDSEYQRRKSVPARIPQGIAPTVTSRVPEGAAAPPARLPLAATPTVSFEGIPQTVYTPPSPNLAVGPDDIIQVVNSNITRYSRANQQTDSVDLRQWFSPFLPTICGSGSCILGDVSITYDQMHGHFILMLQALDSFARTSYLLLSVSNGATYASGWKSWILNETLDGNTPTANWADFPQPGVDGVAFYATSLQFSFTSGTFQYSKVRIFRKADLYNPALTTLPYNDIFNLLNLDGTVASTLQVPHLRGRTELGTSSGFMVNASDVNLADYYTLWLINNPAGTNPAVTPFTINNVWKYSYPASAPQLGSPVLLDTGPSSIAKVVQRDGLLYFALNTGYTDEPITVTYSVVDALSKKLTLQQRLNNGTFFYPAFDVPASTGPGNVLPNNPIVGTTTTPGGTLTYPSILSVHPGVTPYTVTGNLGMARWGDFFGGSVDPTQGGLWITGEFAKTPTSWGTWNAYFPWNTSQEFSDVDPSRSGFSYVNVMKLWGITQGCTPTTYCPEQNVTRIQMAVFIIRSLYGNTFPYQATPYFTDVPASDASFPYVQKLRELGITAGCTPTLFCPGDTLTRWQAAVFIIRAKFRKLFGEDFSFPSTAYFTDVLSTDGSFRYVQKFRELGYTVGCGPTKFCPNDPLNREAAAIFLVRAFFN